MSNDIVVVGSLNMDLVVEVKRRPVLGETIYGESFFTNPGGKGANQAFAAAKLGAKVSMIGSLGLDGFGDELLANLKKVGVETTHVQRVNSPSGIALITIEKGGDNSIIVTPGANQFTDASYIREKEVLIKEAQLLMVQLELPMEAIIEAITIANENNIPVLLDPTPVNDEVHHMLEKVDYILPNQSEIEQLTGIKVLNIQSSELASDLLIERGVKTVLSKLGDQGVFIKNKREREYVRGREVTVVDSTAAGDAFAGGFAASIVKGCSILEAAEYANIVGALTVTAKGAQSAIPYHDEVMAKMNRTLE